MSGASPPVGLSISSERIWPGYFIGQALTISLWGRSWVATVRLERIARERKMAFICAERLPWRCHRRFIARELEKRGWQVIHIIDKGRDWVSGKRS
jgi:hypothetical protein